MITDLDEVLPALLADVARHGTGVLATIVRTEGSAPLPVGTSMAVTASGQVIGGVSGGCLEGAVHVEAGRVLGSGRPVLHRYAANDEPFGAALTCGGDVWVWIEPITRPTAQQLNSIEPELKAGRSVTRAVVLAADAEVSQLVIMHGAVPNAQEPIGNVRDHALTQALHGALAEPVQHPRIMVLGGVEVFLRSWRPRARMIIVGADTFAAALSDQATLLGYAVTVCDPRPAFTTAERFPSADQVVRSWPDRYLRDEAHQERLDDRTVVCVLSHDSRIDVPTIAVALGLTELRFVGALGSPSTVAERRRRLIEAGCTPDVVDRLRSPVGLDLGGRTAAETAASIMAEVVADLHGGTGRPLAGTRQCVHPHVTTPDPAASPDK